MVCKTKTLINDVGSAVLAEVTSQLNRALSVTPFLHFVQSAGTAGSGAANSSSVPPSNNTSDVIFVASEDCLVTSIRLCQTLGSFINSVAGGAENYMCLLKVPSLWTDAQGNPQTTQCAPSAHGDAVAVPLGGDPATYTLEFLSDGTVFPDTGFIYNLFDIAAAGTALSAVGDFSGTWVAAAGASYANTPAVSLNPKGISMVAGDALLLGMANDVVGAGAPASTMRTQSSIGYRPVKDEIILQPNFVQTMRGYSSVDRAEK